MTAPRKLDARTLRAVAPCKHPMRSRVCVGDPHYNNGNHATTWCGVCGAYAYDESVFGDSPSRKLAWQLPRRARRIDRAAKGGGR